MARQPAGFVPSQPTKPKGPGFFSRSWVFTKKFRKKVRGGAVIAGQGIMNAKRARSQKKASRLQKEVAKSRIEASKAQADVAKAQVKLIESQIPKKQSRWQRTKEAGRRHRGSILGFIFIILFIGGGIYLLNQSGALEKYEVFGGIAYAEVAKNTVNQFAKFIKTGLSPETYKFTNPAAVSTNLEVVGINIKSFTYTRKFYYINQPFKLEGALEVKDVGRDITVEAICELDNSKENTKEKEIVFGEVKLFPGEFTKTENGAKKTIKVGSTQGLNIDCTFPENLIELETGKTEASRRATLKVLYDYPVQSEYSVYVVSREEDRENFFQREDLLGVGSINIGGTLSSTYSGGPVEVNLGLGRGVIRQPLIPGNYDFIVGVVNNRISWLGEIEELKSLKLFLSEGLTGNQEDCTDFDVNGNVVSLKSEILEDFTRDECSTLKEVIEASQRDVEQGKRCLDQYNKHDQQFFCNLKVEKKYQDDAIPIVLKARANYIYKVSKSTNVNFVQQRSRLETKEETGETGDNNEE